MTIICFLFQLCVHRRSMFLLLLIFFAVVVVVVVAKKRGREKESRSASQPLESMGLSAFQRTKRCPIYSLLTKLLLLISSK